MSLVSGISLSEVVFCGMGRDDVTLKLGLFLRYSAKVFSNWYLLFGCRKVTIANASKCLEFLFGEMICVLKPVPLGTWLLTS